MKKLPKNSVVRQGSVTKEAVGTFRVEASFEGEWKIVFRGIPTSAGACREGEAWYKKGVEIGYVRPYRVMEYRG
jgi:hypothetical protein